MKNEHHFRRFGNLEFMIVDLNSRISELNSYLTEEIKIKEIGELTPIRKIEDLLVRIENTDSLKLLHHIKDIKLFQCAITNISKAIENSSRNEKCCQIEMIWRDCRNTLKEVVDAVDAMRISINKLSGSEIVKDDTEIIKLIQICDTFDTSPFSPVTEERIKYIFEKTLNNTYETKCPKNASPTVVVVIMAILLLVAFLFTLCSCDNDNNKSGSNTTLRICNPNHPDGNNKVTIWFGHDEKEICLFNTYDTIINRCDTLKIKCKDCPLDDDLLVFLFKDTIILQDTIINFECTKEFRYSDTSITRIKIVPLRKCNNVCSYGYSSNKYLFKLLLFVSMIAFVLLLLLVLRPLFERCIDNRHKLDEKILNDKLRMHNEWQEILQNQYRLGIRRTEMELNLQEKRRKQDIEELVKRNEHERNMERLNIEQQIEQNKSYMKCQTDIKISENQRLKELNETITKIIASLTSK